MPTISARGKPSCCAACESRTLRNHCGSAECHWVICTKCRATTGIIGKWADGQFIGWTRATFSGTKRALLPASLLTSRSAG